jgi:hypothetical protein
LVLFFHLLCNTWSDSHLVFKQSVIFLLHGDNALLLHWLKLLVVKDNIMEKRLSVGWTNTLYLGLTGTSFILLDKIIHPVFQVYLH